MRRWRTAVLALLIAAGCRGTSEDGGEACVTHASRIQVRGRILDTGTGSPVAGATLWAHPTVKDTLEETGRPPDIEPDAISAADRAFDLRVSRLWYASGEPSRLPPFYGVRALAIEANGYPRQVVDCTRGRWTEHEVRAIGDIAATVDLGEVRVHR